MNPFKNYDEILKYYTYILLYRCSLETFLINKAKAINETATAVAIFVPLPHYHKIEQCSHEAAITRFLEY